MKGIPKKRKKPKKKWQKNTFYFLKNPTTKKYKKKSKNSKKNPKKCNNKKNYQKTKQFKKNLKWSKMVLFWAKNKFATLLVLPFEDISIQPELSRPPLFRIQGA